MMSDPHQSPRLIKRYANRKLYDTVKSAYVTLDEIADMVKAGEDLQIIDNRTGEDLTGVTLTQIIYEDQKKPDQQKGLPLATLRSLIQSGGEMFARIGNPVARIGNPVAKVSDDIKRAREKLEGESQAAVRDLIEGTHRAIDDRGRKLDKQVKDTITQMTHFASLAAQIDRLENQVCRLEQQITSLSGVLMEIREDVRRDGDDIPS